MCPSIIRVIALRQAREALGGPKGAFFVLFWTVLVTLAVWAGSMTSHGSRQAHAASEASAREAYAAWTAAYPPGDWRPVYMTAENPILLQMPPAPAQAIAQGVSGLGGTWAIPVGYHLRELEGRKADLSPLGTLLGGLDLAGLVAVVGALAALALGYDAVSGERERGTLALHFANPVGRRTFLLGKVLGSLLALGVALGVPLAMGACALFAVGAIPIGPNELARVGLFLLLSLGYLALWCVLAVGVSAAVRSSATSFVALAAVWLVLAVAVPKVALAVADRAHPMPAAMALEQRLAKALDESKDYYRAELGRWQETYGRRPDAREGARLKLAYYDHHYRKVQAIVSEYDATAARWYGLFEALSAASPTFAYQLATWRLADTDATRHRDFLAACNRYLEDLKYQAEERVIQGKMGPPAYAELPRLGFVERPITDPARHGLVYLLLTLGEMLVGLAFAMLAFRRAPVLKQAAA